MRQITCMFLEAFGLFAILDLTNDWRLWVFSFMVAFVSYFDGLCTGQKL